MEGAEMTEPAPRRRGVRRWRVLVLVAAAAALLAGCDLATGTVRTATELEKAGIRNPNLDYDGGTATLEYDANPNPLEARAEQDQAAAIIWRNLPFRIEQVTVVARGGVLPSRDYPRALLERQLGPRPAGLDRSVEDIARRATLIAVVVALVVLVLVVVVIVLVVRAVRRRPSPQPPGGWPQAGAPQPWGQPGPQPGWGQPGPQPGWPQPPPPPGQQPWGAQPPSPAWPPPAPAQGAPPPPPQAVPPGPAGAEPPSRGPGDTQRLEPDPPPPPRGEQPGPVPPA
jgi:hypothetical protein